MQEPANMEVDLMRHERAMKPGGVGVSEGGKRGVVVRMGECVSELVLGRVWDRNRGLHSATAVLGCGVEARLSAEYFIETIGMRWFLNLEMGCREKTD